MKNLKENDNYKWYHKSVVYHIYTRSFKDSNKDGVGDLRGIIDRLDYLAGSEKSLGIGAIWLSPFYKSPQVDYGYDISDYKDIDPMFGDLETFKTLVKECHKKNIRIIIDFVINHTSSEHKWFKESQSSRENSKRDWYIWRDPKPDGSPPNNWRSVFGGPAWTLDEKTGQYYFHSFLPEQPDLNWRYEEVQEEMKQVGRFWLDMGVDGFRIDAIEHLIEDSYLRDDPRNPDYVPLRDDPYLLNEHLFSKSQKDLSYCINALCELISEYPDRFIVSEAYVDIPKIVSLYQACEQKVHAPFNFNLMGKRWSATEYRQFVDEFEKALSPNDWPNYVFGNHDRSRLVSRLGEKRARVVAVLLLTLRGMPFIYYGDEIGMADVEISLEKIKDPFAKKLGETRYSRDPERTPMQWSGEKYAGFSEVEPWLPVSPDFEKKNVEEELKDPSSILNLYRSLIGFRNKTPALQYGTYKSLDTLSSEIFSYVREYEGQKILIILNFSDKEIEETIPFKELKFICSTYGEIFRVGDNPSGKVSLRPNEGCIFEVLN